MDFNIRLSNGQILRGFIKSPGDGMLAVIIMIHGLGEHIQRYTSWAGMMNSKSFVFAGVDLPGHGRSEGRRGHIKSKELLDEMIGILINECRKTFPGIPLFLYGHDLGGSLVLSYIIQNNPRVKGAVITSPCLQLLYGPNKAKAKLTTLLRFILPWIVSSSGFPVEKLSRNSDVIMDYRNDPLNHDKISGRLYTIARDTATYAMENASVHKVPVLIMHGGDDLICSPDGSREFASKSRNTELKIWEDGFHDLHYDLFNKDLFDYIVKWINKRIGK